MIILRYSLLIALFATLPAHALASFRDPVTGFGVSPPAPFVIEPSSHRSFDVMVGLRSTTNIPPAVGRSPDSSQPFVCQAGFKAAAQNNDLTKAEINAFMAKPEWRNVIRATMELVFQIDGERSFTLRGYRGIELRARPKMGPGAEDVRALLSFVETAKGRTALICLTNRRSFEAAIRQFRVVRATITPPE